MMKRANLAEAAYLKIKTMILESELDENLEITEVKMAKLLEMSRTPIREALRRLETERYIIRIPQVGFRVKKSTLRELIETLDVRESFQVFGLNKIFNEKVYSHDGILEMRNALELQKKSIDVNDYWGYLEAERQFHRGIVKLSDNREMVSIFEDMGVRVFLAGKQLKCQPIVFNNLKDKHNAYTEIFEMIKQLEDKERVIELLHQLTERTKKRIMDGFLKL